ncbi:hypothetical protein [Phenylobacterium sp.]|uniref:hypothetical protein n=1 Tax=Phenylobacterium sp. TaxID=1871053 RepID=UPI0025D130BA|nr:hypothetical protein [Phenylobacterium sp.]MBX3483786.1 hypothetical protein [Phenylobacterium sp.]MCW5760903.1 hypothetical protein [Phenylobacterium sp.]
MSGRPVEFRTHAALWGGALIAGACGLLALAVGAATLQMVLFPAPGAPAHGWLPLLPTLAAAGVAAWWGTRLFRIGHAGLKAARGVERDRLDVVASTATAGVGALIALAASAVTVRVAVSGVQGLLRPRAFDAGAGVLWLALALGVGATAALIGGRIAWSGLRRLRER